MNLCQFFFIAPGCRTVASYFCTFSIRIELTQLRVLQRSRVLMVRWWKVQPMMQTHEISHSSSLSSYRVDFYTYMAWHCYDRRQRLSCSLVSRSFLSRLL